MQIETGYTCKCGFEFYWRESIVDHAQFAHCGEYSNNLASLEDFIEEMIQPSPLD